eukprot:8614375-Pyramimonas_sp.AAC.1
MLQYDEGVLETPVISPTVVQDSDCLIIGAHGQHGGICAEVRHFLESWAEFQTAGCLLKVRTHTHTTPRCPQNASRVVSASLALPSSFSPHARG